MYTGNSRLFPSLSAGILAMIVFIVTAASIMFGRFWITLIFFVLTFLLFLLDSNPFVRRCSAVSMLYYLLAFSVQLILMRLLALIPFIGKVFPAAGWILCVLIAVFAIIGAIRACNGELFVCPGFGKFISRLCEKLGVY